MPRHITASVVKSRHRSRYREQTKQKELATVNADQRQPKVHH